MYIQTERWSRNADPHVEEVTARIDALYNRTSDELQRVPEARRRLCRAFERYEEARARATSAGGINYERMGRYGVKIDASHNDHGTEESYIAMLDAEAEYAQAVVVYRDEKERQARLLDAAGLTENQKRVIILRYDGTYPDYNTIAAKTGLPSYWAASKQEQRGFVKLANYLDSLEN